MDSDSKLRVLYVAKILYEETDPDHPLTTSQILNKLQDKYNMPAHRTTIGGDVEILKRFGLGIEVYRGSQVQYNLYDRNFDLAELKLLIDTVESSKFITKEKSDDLVAKLSSLTSKNYARDIKRNLYSEGRLKKDNESIYLTIEAVNEAINQKKKISFQYFQYDVRKKRHLKNNGIPYKFSPYSLVWNGDYYYMVGYCDKHKKIGSYRIDRVYKRPIILEEKIVPMPDDFDISEFSDSMFHMYNSERKTVQLICANETMDAILDKFGMDVATYAYDMKSFKVEVNVAVSHVFYSWVFGFDGRVKILAPDDVKQEYKEMILKSAKKLEKDSD
jgi:predicted DNA-binding transcriptional regulator YafY